MSSWAPVAAWLGFIALTSGDGFSASQTSRVIGPIVAWLFPDLSPVERAEMHHIARKLAHVVEYGFLGLLLFRAFWRTWEARALGAAAATVATVFTIASLDELRQSTSAVRTGNVFDVVLDTTGGVLAALVGLLIVWWRKPQRVSGRG